MSYQALTNDTKLDVPMRIQRNKEFRLTFKLRNGTTYYTLSAYYFKLTIIDDAGNTVLLLDDNRFGKGIATARELIVTPDETDTLDPARVYTYDLMVVNDQQYKDYWTKGRVLVVDRITSNPGT